MTHDSAPVDTLIRENEILKKKVTKLTAELSKQLEDNVLYIQAIWEKERSITESAYSNSMLLIAGKMLQERYRVMAENIDEIVSIVDIRGIYVYVNHKAAEFYGLTIKDMIGKSIFEIMGKETGNIYKLELFDPVTKNNRDASSSTIFMRGNRTIHLESQCHPIHDEDGVVIGVLNITHDLTADKKKA